MKPQNEKWDCFEKGLASLEREQASAAFKARILSLAQQERRATIRRSPALRPAFVFSFALLALAAAGYVGFQKYLNFPAAPFQKPAVAVTAPLPAKPTETPAANEPPAINPEARATVAMAPQTAVAEVPRPDQVTLADTLSKRFSKTHAQAMVLALDKAEKDGKDRAGLETLVREKLAQNCDADVLLLALEEHARRSTPASLKEPVPLSAPTLAPALAKAPSAPETASVPQNIETEKASKAAARDKTEAREEKVMDRQERREKQLEKMERERERREKER